MTPQDALALTGSFAPGARVGRRLHAAPAKSSFLVERRGERFVLRIDAPPAQALGLDRAGEFAVLAAVWRAGLAPEPVALVAGPPAILVTRYVPGLVWRAEDLRDPARLVRLAQLLRRLHDARLPGPALDLAEACRRYAARIGTAQSRALAARAARLVARSRSDSSTHCLCHNDPIAENIVGMRATMLIDWEYAAVCDPLFDLAVATTHHRLPRVAVGRLVSAYFGDRAKVPWERLEGFRAAYVILRRLWARALACATYQGVSTPC